MRNFINCQIKPEDEIAANTDVRRRTPYQLYRVRNIKYGPQKHESIQVTHQRLLDIFQVKA
jgi:hypothetical protein